MERDEQRRIVEALVLASPEPISGARIAQLIPGCKPGAAKDLVNELNTHYQETDRAFEIWEVAGGYQIRTRAEFSGYLQKLQKQRPLRLSRAALETLSIVAYRQPATRAEIEQVRGVDAGPVVKSLLERQLVKIVGQREVPGRPMLYGTTRRFLEVFGLKGLGDLPALRELEELAREHGVANAAAEAGEEDAGAESGEADATIESPEGPAAFEVGDAPDSLPEIVDPAGAAPERDEPPAPQASELGVVGGSEPEIVMPPDLRAAVARETPEIEAAGAGEGDESDPLDGGEDSGER